MIVVGSGRVSALEHAFNASMTDGESSYGEGA
jgi:hypothetical protein